MSILAQYGVLHFYGSKAVRPWDRLQTEGDSELFRVFFETNHIPAVMLVADSASSATLQLCNTLDEEVGSAMTMTIQAATGYKVLRYLGQVITGNDDGDYYLKLTYTGGTLYSDVFGWTSDSGHFSELMKVRAVSSDIRLGKNYMLDMTNFVYECYLNAEYLGIQPEIEEELASQYGTNLVFYANLVSTRQFNLYVTEHIYRFLLGLRILESNGTVTVSWKGIDYTANDTMVEKQDEHIPELSFQVTLSFVDISEIVSVSNETN
jgi:hypothetical protein